MHLSPNFDLDRQSLTTHNNTEAERQETVLLYQNALSSQVLNAITGSVFAYVHYSAGQSPMWVAVWWVSLVLVLTARAVLAQNFFESHANTTSSQWRRRYIALTALTVMVWATGASFILEVGGDAFLLTAILLLGNVAGSVGMLCAVPLAQRLYSLGIMIPTCLCLALKATTIFGWLTVLLAFVFLIATLVSGNHIHRLLHESIRQGLEKGALAERLEQANKEALAALVERKQAEQRLQISASVFDNSQEGIVIAQADLRIDKVNRAFSQMTGYTAEEAIGQKLTLLKSEQQQEAPCPEMWATLREQGAWQGELWNCRKNGEVFPVDVAFTGVRGEDGHLTHLIAQMTDITRRKESEAAINDLAFFDPLTRLPNRNQFLKRFHDSREVSLHTRDCGGLLFIDLDNFKSLNDTMGHTVGDQLLQQVAQRINACVREQDVVARFGGDEFIVLLQHVAPTLERARTITRNVAEKICSAINEPYKFDDHVQWNSCSIGAVVFEGGEESLGNLLKHADMAMYEAKAEGRNVVRFFDKDMQVIVNVRASLEADLRQAIRLQQFKLNYQPQVDASGHVTGAEALLRWRHPHNPAIGPADFIPVAEETGLIVPIGEWVIEEACRQLVAWQQHPELSRLTLSINISVRQFTKATFVDDVKAILSKVGANPGLLKLEITESVLLQNVSDVTEKLSALKRFGIGAISLDDFGTGYSSLGYLKRLPIDELKIDAGFVRDILVDPNDAAIARTVIALAHSLDLGVIAEGVESTAQVEFLRSQGCRAFQGYLFGKPMDADTFADRLLSRHSPTLRTDSFPV